MTVGEFDIPTRSSLDTKASTRPTSCGQCGLSINLLASQIGTVSESFRILLRRAYIRLVSESNGAGPTGRYSNVLVCACPGQGLALLRFSRRISNSSSLCFGRRQQITFQPIFRTIVTIDLVAIGRSSLFQREPWPHSSCTHIHGLKIKILHKSYVIARCLRRETCYVLQVYLGAVDFC
jgi:hypothetical protein